jgi:flagellar FliL protein
MADAKQEAAPGGSKKKMIIIIVIAAIVAIGGAVGATVMLMGGKADKAETAKKDGEHGEESADAEEGEDGEEVAEGEEGEGGEGHAAAPVYVPLDPAFVVNFQDKKHRTKFLKAEISVVAKTPKVQEAITAHMPAVRNSIVMLLSRQVYEDLMSTEGKEKLRTDALDEVKAIMKKTAGKKVGKGVEDLYFSSLVMQ